jgi:hypothetical protein
MSTEVPFKVELHLPEGVQVDASELSDLGAAQIFTVGTKGFNGLAETIVTLVGSAAVVVRCFEWVRARWHYQTVMDFRDGKVRINQQEERTGVTIIIDQNGKVHRYEPGEAPDATSIIKRLLS